VALKLSNNQEVIEKILLKLSKEHNRKVERMTTLSLHINIFLKIIVIV